MTSYVTSIPLKMMKKSLDVRDVAQLGKKTGCDWTAKWLGMYSSNWSVQTHHEAQTIFDIIIVPGMVMYK